MSNCCALEDTLITHPVNDFLTPEITQFLQQLESKTIKQIITVIHGTGSTGISSFLNILKKCVKCFFVHQDFYNNEVIISQIKRVAPQLIIVLEHESNESLMSYMNLKVLTQLNLLDIPIIVPINIDIDGSDSIDLLNLIANINKFFSRRYSVDEYDSHPHPEVTAESIVKIIKFDTQYCHDDESLNSSCKISSKMRLMTYKKALDSEAVVNDDAVRILQKVMKI